MTVATGTLAVAPRDVAPMAPLLLGAMAGAMVAGRIESALLCLGIAAAIGALARAGWPRPRLVGLLAGGAAISVVLNAYLTDGVALPLPALFGRAATAEGCWFGILLALRVWGAAMAVHGLAALWPGERAADEIAARLAPLERLRVPVTRARVIVGLALRFVPLLGDEIRRVRALQRLRAGRPLRGAGERLRQLQAILVPALTGALERAERVALALEARHYRMRPVAAPRPHRGWQTAGIALVLVALLWRG
jgi:energy-coupling factor transporter transmembrane protein EcfT